MGQNAQNLVRFCTAFAKSYFESIRIGELIDFLDQQVRTRQKHDLKVITNHVTIGSSNGSIWLRDMSRMFRSISIICSYEDGLCSIREFHDYVAENADGNLEWLFRYKKDYAEIDEYNSAFEHVHKIRAAGNMLQWTANALGFNGRTTQTVLSH